VTTIARAIPRAYRPHVLLAAAVIAWLATWFATAPLADWLSFGVLRLEHGTAFGEAVAFFLFDVPKVLLLLTGIVWLVAIVRSFFQPERVRAALAGRNVVAGTVAAALFGIVTPFCSCSAVPLFIGFVGVGIPLGVTFAFLVSSPMVNEVALVLLWGLFGPTVAIAYMAAGIMVAIVAGLVIGKLGLERYLEPSVLAIRSAGPGAGAAFEVVSPTWSERTAQASDFTRDLVRKILPYILVGIGVGAFVHGYVPTETVVALGGRDNPLAVPIVVLLGVPLYSNAAGTIPIVQALIDKGLPLGTTLAFMMAVTALSLPEFIILRRVMRPQLLAVFGGVVATGILVIGYLFNALA
jgi:uncharacterized protein